MMTVKEIANTYVERYQRNTIKEYKPGYHISPPVGWLNDPNGFSIFKEEFHLFYQYHPYSSVWGPMHWAHLISKDMIKWEWCPIAIAPEEIYELDGCFSGTAIDDNGEHVLIYTSHLHPNPGNKSVYRQQQCLAKSMDGVHYEKSSLNPVIRTDEIPEGNDLQDFRDPKLIKRNNIYYCVVASKSHDGSGQLLVYESEELSNWKYKGILCSSENLIGKMWECPDVFSCNGKDVLLISPMFMKQRDYEFSNLHSAICVLGNFDLDKPLFEIENYFEIDLGLDFYAPQTVLTSDGRRVMIGWMQTWERNYPTNDMKHNWTGAMTLPRELSIVEGKLIQKPVREIEAYC